MTADPITRITLVRHGETVLPRHLLGVTDPPLNAEGIARMAAVLADGDAIDHCYSSPRQRCLVSARALAERVGAPLTVEAGLAELDFGEWDGRSYSDLWQAEGEALGSFWQDPWANPPPGGESMTAFANRVEACWQALLNRHTGKRLLVISHGGVIRHLMATILQMPLPGSQHLSAIDLPYGARVEVSVWHDDAGRQWPKIHWGA